MSIFVYILYSKKKSKFYTGISVDPNKRLKQHNSGHSQYTKSGVPWIIVWSSKKQTRHQAEILERKIKHLTQIRKIRFMLKYKDGVTDLHLLNTLMP